MEKNSLGTPLLVASLIVGAAVIAASFVIQSSLDRATGELSKVLVAINAARPAAPRAAAPSRPAPPDPSKHYSVNTKGSPQKGAANAKLSVVQFSSFQCGYCARVIPTLDQVLKEYGDQVAIVFKHMPPGPTAAAAHAASEAAHRQGKFWEMHDLIFANQRQLTPQKYEEYAQQIGLDMDRFRKDMASPEVKKKVETDAAEAIRLGVTGTPGFFINGRFLPGAKPFESFKQLIDEELKKKG